jgi:hypothetical protein
MIGDVLSMSDSPPSSPSVGGWIRDKAVETLTDQAVNYLRKSVDELNGPPPIDELQRADQDLMRAAHPTSLSKGVR